MSKLIKIPYSGYYKVNATHRFIKNLGKEKPNKEYYLPVICNHSGITYAKCYIIGSQATPIEFYTLNQNKDE